ncbi:hypothetical protein SLE2022_291340 [Rubroshorea leprosula]
MEEWSEREEAMLRQCSCDIWIQEGDHNTHFFHRRASKRREQNKIERLTGDDGVWKSELVDLQYLVSRYFTIFFSSTQPIDFSQVTSCLKPCVLDNDNDYLTREFTEIEIPKALFQMHPSKAWA